MHKVFHVMRHEFRLATANKAYVILTILGPFLIFAITVLPTLISRNPGTIAGGKPLYVLSASPEAEAALAAAFDPMNIEVLPAENEAGGKASALAGSAVGFFVLETGWPDAGKAVWYSRTGTEAAFYSAASAVLAGQARWTRIASSGVDPAVLARLLSDPVFEVVKLEAGGGEETKDDEDFLQILFTAMSFVMLLYMTVLLYGQLIGRSVVLEKTSKTVEIMLSSVTSRVLMFGKIFGLGAAGLIQYSVWVLMALTLTKLVGPALGLSLPPAVSPANLGWLVLFFVLAFFLYSSAYAALGAASEDEHHLGQIAWPLLMFLVVPLVMIGAIISNPDSPIAVFLSIFPMTSPIVMLMRILVSPPPAWHIALCLVLLVASVAGMALLAAKVFRVGILMTGKRPRIREILRWVLVR